MKAIVGLGNPGPRYRHTRHNVGWQVLDRLAARWSAGKPVTARYAEVQRCLVGGEEVLLVKPQTFMNDSGKAVRALVEKDGLALEDLLVIYDDLDLALGRIRVRPGGSAGGHRGILSIQQELARSRAVKEAREAGQGHEAAGERNGKCREQGSAEFARIKIGLGRPPAGVDPIDFVLAPFTPDERSLIEPALDWAAEAAECWIREGIGPAMNRFNGLMPSRAEGGVRVTP